MPRSKEAIKRAAHNFYKRTQFDPRYRAKRAANCKKFRQNNPDYGTRIHVRFANLKGKGRFRSMEVSLTFDQYKDLVEGKNCHYCDKSMAGTKGSGLDRIDSSQGYIPGNCLPCCYTCNVMKSNLTTEQFITHIQTILGHYLCQKH